MKPFILHYPNGRTVTFTFPENGNTVDVLITVPGTEPIKDQITPTDGAVWLVGWLQQHESA